MKKIALAITTMGLFLPAYPAVEENKFQEKLQNLCKKTKEFAKRHPYVTAGAVLTAAIAAGTTFDYVFNHSKLYHYFFTIGHKEAIQRYLTAGLTLSDDCNQYWVPCTPNSRYEVKYNSTGPGELSVVPGPNHESEVRTITGDERINILKKIRDLTYKTFNELHFYHYAVIRNSFYSFEEMDKYPGLMDTYKELHKLGLIFIENKTGGYLFRRVDMVNQIIHNDIYSGPVATMLGKNRIGVWLASWFTS